MTEPRQYPCQRLNPDETCPELKNAWAQILELLARLERFENTKLRDALLFIESQGLAEMFRRYQEDNE